MTAGSGWDDEQILAWRDRVLSDYNRRRGVQAISTESWKRANLWDDINGEPDPAAMVPRRFRNLPRGSTPLQGRIIEFLRREGRGTAAGLTEALGFTRESVDESVRSLLQLGVLEVVDHEPILGSGGKRRVVALVERWESV